MTKEKAQELLEWLYAELEQTAQTMKDARKKREYTREAYHEGKADALMRIIKKLKIENKID
jgi:ABC-type Fe3+-hydroxamate transport system substrate-binding protein